MDIAKISKGDTLRIKNHPYEVIYTTKESEKHKDSWKEFLGIYLLDNKTDHMEPTHMIKYYNDAKIVFLQLIGEKIAVKDIEVQNSEK